MVKKPLVSIITPAYNRRRTLPNAIQSIINQTYDNWELIVVDDRSTDNTEDLINSYSLKDKRVKYLRNNGKKGAAAARNCGIKNSSGDYLAFLDSDDQWFENHLADSIKVLQEDGVSVCFSLWIEKNNQGEIYKVLNSELEFQKFNKAISALNPVVHTNRVIFSAPDFFEYINSVNTLHYYHVDAMVIKREVIQKVGLMNETLLAGEDVDFISRIIYDYDICLIRDYHFMYHQGEDNIYGFMDRRNCDLEKILSNRQLIKKLTFCNLAACKMYKLRKDLIKKSTKLKRKDLCLDRCNLKMAIKYFSAGYINKRVNKPKAVYLLLKSLSCKYDHEKIKHILNILIPFIYKDLDTSLVTYGFH